MITNETQEQLEARGWDFADEFIPDEPTVNNQDKTVDVSENGTIEVTPDEDFTGLGKVTINTEVECAKPKWTGHADAEGLKAIGWTDEDIAYYQENGVNWNEEDDEWHKVTDDNKALYGVLTADNISTYKDRIVYLPKIDTSSVTSMIDMFYECYSLLAIPMLDTSNVESMNNMFGGTIIITIPLLDTSSVTDMGNMFSGCYSLTTIPLLDTSSVTDMGNMFDYCSALTSIPMLDTSSAKTMSNMFRGCYSLTTIPLLDTSSVTSMYNMFSGCYSLTTIPLLYTHNVTDMGYTFSDCYSLTTIPLLDTSSVTDMRNMFSGCYSLTTIPLLDTSSVTKNRNMLDTFYSCFALTNVNLKDVKSECQLNNSALLSKDSLLYLINNEAATSAITITLASYAYDRWAADPDIVAALANHPNISLAN